MDATRNSDLIFVSFRLPLRRSPPSRNQARCHRMLVRKRLPRVQDERWNLQSLLELNGFTGLS